MMSFVIGHMFFGEPLCSASFSWVKKDAVITVEEWAMPSSCAHDCHVRLKCCQVSNQLFRVRDPWKVICVFCCFLQYWYEGNEMGDLPVDFSIVWDGDFPIDKPPSMRGEGHHLHFATCLFSIFWDTAVRQVWYRALSALDKKYLYIYLIGIYNILHYMHLIHKYT